MKRAVFLLLFAPIAAAVEPNFVRTTVYGVGNNGYANLITTDYSDGLGRSIQSKVKIDDSKDRVSCTFYDDAGRPSVTTKVFTDNTNPGSYMPGTLSEINISGGQLQSKYIGDTRAYSYTNYSDDPLSRVIEQNGPGNQFLSNGVKKWYFGVSKISCTFPPIAGDIDFKDGFISSTMNGQAFDGALTALYNYLLDIPYFTNPKYFLIVTKDAVGNYTQELKDLFGKTVATRSSDGSNEIITNYYYDILGNLTTEIAPKPKDPQDPEKVINTINDTRYIYNSIGQLISKITPDGGTFEYNYTPTGQLESDISKDENSYIYRTRLYEYDNLDRQITTKLVDLNEHESGLTIVMKNYYDNVDILNQDAVKYNIPLWLLSSLENLKGKLVASVAVNIVNGITYYVSDLFSYNEDGQITKKFKIIPGIQYQEISYTYDIHGKVLTENTVSGSDVIEKEYQYDAEGRLKYVFHVNNNSKLLAAYNYDELGRLESKGLPIGGGQEYKNEYNIRDWITSISPPVGANYSNKFEETIPFSQYKANGNIGEAIYRYTYDGEGSPASHDLTYSYDEVNRLTGVAADRDYSSTYAYDEIGRLTSKTEGSDAKPGYMYYTGNNRLMNTKNSKTVKDYCYDKHGNLVVDKIKNMVIQYDYRDMPVAFRFYNEIPSGIEVDGKGTVTFPTGADLYDYIKSEINKPGATTSLLSQVVMLYDASGNRVLKMEGK